MLIHGIPLYNFKFVAWCAMNATRVTGTTFLRPHIHYGMLHAIGRHFRTAALLQKSTLYIFQQDSANPHRENKSMRYFYSAFGSE